MRSVFKVIIQDGKIKPLSVNHAIWSSTLKYELFDFV